MRPALKRDLLVPGIRRAAVGRPSQLYVQLLDADGGNVSRAGDTARSLRAAYRAALEQPPQSPLLWRPICAALLLTRVAAPSPCPVPFRPRRLTSSRSHSCSAFSCYSDSHANYRRAFACRQSAWTAEQISCLHLSPSLLRSVPEKRQKDRANERACEGRRGRAVECARVGGETVYRVDKTNDRGCKPSPACQQGKLSSAAGECGMHLEDAHKSSAAGRCMLQGRCATSARAST